MVSLIQFYYLYSILIIKIFNYSQNVFELVLALLSFSFMLSLLFSSVYQIIFLYQNWKCKTFLLRRNFCSNAAIINELNSNSKWLLQLLIIIAKTLLAHQTEPNMDIKPFCSTACQLPLSCMPLITYTCTTLLFTYFTCFNNIMILCKSV